MYTVFDSASASYDRPFVAPSDNAAIRSFSDIAVGDEHPIGKHPEDYSLYRIGAYDDNKAELEPTDRECLITAEEAVANSRKIAKGSLKGVENYG